MSKPFRLGFLTHVEGAGDPRHIYQDTLAWFTTADQLGFDVGWLAEHHFKNPNGRLPSLFPFLAAAGERTRHIRLGTSIIILPVQQPLRVAEDAAVVDALTGGRLDYIAGRAVAALVYKRREHLINLFIWPAENTRIGVERVQSSVSNGYNTLRWSGNGMTFWAISDLNPGELQEFMRRFQDHLARQ